MAARTRCATTRHAASTWALAARPGDRLEIGGPRGSAIIPADFDWYWLVGDETRCRRLDAGWRKHRQGRTARRAPLRSGLR
nr:siderophore-interacting protein [Ancylobacter pratisalsi]